MNEQLLDSRSSFVCKIYFNKDCDCANWLNEHALPNFIQGSSWCLLMQNCIDALAAANTNLMKYTKAMKNVPALDGVENENDVRALLEIVCVAFESCRNFVALEEVVQCVPCDGDSPKNNKKRYDKDEKSVPMPPKKKVTNEVCY